MEAVKSTWTGNEIKTTFRRLKWHSFLMGKFMYVIAIVPFLVTIYLITLHNSKVMYIWLPSFLVFVAAYFWIAYWINPGYRFVKYIDGEKPQIGIVQIVPVEGKFRLKLLYSLTSEEQLAHGKLIEKYLFYQQFTPVKSSFV